MPQYQISSLLPHQYSACETMVRKSFATVAAQFGLTRENCPSNPAFWPSGQLAADAKDGKEMYILSSKDKIIGFIQLVVIDNTAVDLAQLCVLPDQRRKGCGKQLLDFAKKRAADMGRQKLTLGMIDSNLPLKKWYIKNGFTQTGARIYSNLPFAVGFLECSVAKVAFNPLLR
ncbi:MAG: GNAT family N-acetyltransferase [Oscillospiraceae bacterium]|nr:GNAT family N-acetyltransferase [Oscillospiraceae bacterium]MBQ9939253.1 GNAT family N-acetyltransferase [Oscillospiraceae bacterium]